MSEIGALIVRLQAETAEFREDLGKVKGDLSDLSDKGGEAGRGMSSGMGEARGGLMLVEESVGVHLPRHLNALIAKIPGVGAAFATMLPIAGVLVAIEIIVKLIEKHNELKEKQSEVAAATANLTLGIDSETHSLANANLKLDDTIAALEHKPKHNFLAEAINDNVIAMDKWAEKSSTDFAKESKELNAYIGWWAILKEEIFMTGDPFGKLGRGVSDAAEKVKSIGTHIDAVKEAMEGLVPGTQIYKDKVSDLVGWYGQLKTAQEQGVTAAKALGSNGIDAMSQFQHGAMMAAHEVTTLSQELEAAGKRVKIAGLEQGKVNLEPLKQKAELEAIAAAGAEKHAAAVRMLNDTEAKTLAISKPEDSSNPDKEAAASKKLALQERDDAIATAVVKITEEGKVYEAKKRAAGDPHEQAKLLAAYLQDVTAGNDAVNQANATERSKEAEADATAAKTKLKLLEDSIAKENALVDKESQQRMKVAQETLKYDEELAKQDLARNEESVNSAVAHENMSWKQEQAAKIAFINQETNARIQALNKEEAEVVKEKQAEIDSAEAKAKAMLAANGGNREDPKYIAYLNQQKLLLAEIDALQKKVGQDSVLAWNAGAAAVKKEQDALTPLQTAMKRVQTEFNSDFAKMIVEGKNFGLAMRQMAGQLLEQMIEFEIKRLEHSIMTNIRETTANAAAKAAQTATNAAAAGTDLAIQTGSDKLSLLSSAEKAAGKAWASAPNPIIGAIEAAAAFVGVLAFAEGGTVPGAGVGDTVPAMLSPGETVVSRVLTDHVAATASGSGSKGNSDVHNTHNWNFQPTVHAMDAEGVDRVLAKHASVFQRHVGAQLRRMNK